MGLHKIVDGVKIDLSPEEEFEVLAEWKANEDNIAANKWLVNRIAQYPEIGAQLDALWKGMQDPNNIDFKDMKAKIAKVKADNPKPQGK